MGERIHLISPDIALETFIQDILMVLKYERLHDVILVGYSYSGIVITAVAERVPERLAHLVYLDAYVPENGQTLAEIIGPEAVAGIEQLAQAEGEGWRIPPLTPPDETHPWTDMPLKPGYAHVAVNNPAAAALPRTFINYIDVEELEPHLVAIKQFAEKIQHDERWRYREINTDHLVMEKAPQEVVRLLLEIVKEARNNEHNHQ
jgi:pimeloyl-ACP methyl ester carboxylesterase